MTKAQTTVLARSLVSQHLPSEWKFEWNKRKSALGVCNYTKKTIFLSEYFLGRVPDEEIKDTILHEIAHALAYLRHGHNGHGWQWKMVCREIGAKPERTHKGEVKNEEAPYAVKCPSCSFKFARHRFNKANLTKLKNGYSWFTCECKQSRMDVYYNGKKIVDGNAAKRPKPPTAKDAKEMTNKELIDYLRKNNLVGS